MRKKSLLLLCCIFLSVVMTSQKYTSKADSLLGHHGINRTCYDAYHYRLSIAFDTEARSIAGSVEMYLTAMSDFNQFQIDLAGGLQIDSIFWKEQPDMQLKYTREFRCVLVSIAPQLIRKGERKVLRICYHGTPQIAIKAPWYGGLDWKKDYNGKAWVGVACEADGPSIWWPCKDDLSDEPDSVVMEYSLAKWNAEDSLMVIGNGRPELLDRKNGIFRWKVNNPINQYNVTFYIGDYFEASEIFQSKYQPFECRYWLLREHRDRGAYFEARVAPMLACYEDYFGPYPFSRDGYQLVESPFAGMEHQSAIAYGNGFQSGYGGVRMSDHDYDYIIIHETGHEWWGNYVSCGDLADMWIHESFTTYTEALYFECLYGKKEGDEWLWKNRRFIENQRPIIGPYGVRYDGSKFDTDMYYKGAWVLQTFRSVLANDSLFFKSLKEIQKECHFKAVNANDIFRVINRTTGIDYTPFFSQYLKRAKIPVLQIKKMKKGKYKVRLLCEENNLSMQIDVGRGSETIGREWKDISIKASQLKSDNDIQRYYLLNIERL